MLDELIKALDVVNLQQGDTIGLKKLCEASGLKTSTWGERLASPSISYMIREALEKAGYIVRAQRRGRFKSFTFSHLL